MTKSHDFLRARRQGCEEDSAQTLDELHPIQKIINELRADPGLLFDKEEVKKVLQSNLAELEQWCAELENARARLEHSRAVLEELHSIVDEAEEPAHLAGQQPKM